VVALALKTRVGVAAMRCTPRDPPARQTTRRALYTQELIRP